jgi:hypothetical protein
MHGAQKISTDLPRAPQLRTDLQAIKDALK